MSSLLDRLQQKTSEGTGLTGAEELRAQLNDRKLGCGCLFWVLAALFGAYYVGSSQFHDGTLGLIAASAVAVAAILAMQVRHFHLYTAAAWTALGVMALGLTGWVYGLVNPAAAQQVLPSFLTGPWMPPILSVSGAAIFGLVWVKLRTAISTPETLYAIQFAAAAKQVDAARQREIVARAFDRLELATTAGIFPLSWESLDLGDQQPVRDAAPSPRYLPLLAIHGVASTEEPWTSSFDGPFLTVPSELPPALAELPPQSVGAIYCTSEQLVYVPFRNDLEVVQIPLANLTHYRLAANALMVGDGKERWAFGVVHAFRMLALIAFLRAFEADADPDGHDLYASTVRRGARPERMPTPKTVQRGRERLATLPSASATARRGLGMVKGLLEREEAGLQFIGLSIAEAWAAVQEGSTSIDVEVSLEEVQTLVGMLTSRALPDGIDHLIEDLLCCWYLSAKRWPELKERVAEWSAEGEEEDDGVDRPGEDDEDDDGDPATRLQEALVELVRALEKDKPRVAAERLAEAKRFGFKDALLVEALEAATRPRLTE